MTCQVSQGGQTVMVNMGEARFHSRDIPVSGPDREVLRERLDLANQSLEYSTSCTDRMKESLRSWLR